MLNPPANITIFNPNFQDGGMIKYWMDKNEAFITGFTDNPDVIKCFEGENRYNLVNDNRFQLYMPTEMFQYAFSFPFLDTKGESFEVTDQFTFFECSKGSESTDKPGRNALSHIISVEQLFQSVVKGGYFAAILPKLWMKGRMKYLRWWNSKANLVAKIKLPPNAVKLYDEESKEYKDHGDFILYIWTKPHENGPECLKYSKFSWTTFPSELKNAFGTSESDTEITTMCRRFCGGEWYYRNILFWRKALNNALMNHNSYTLYNDRALRITAPEDTIFVQPSKAAAATFKVVQSRADIAKLNNGIHIQPGPPIKIVGYSVSSKIDLQEFMISHGYKNVNEGGRNSEPKYVMNYQIDHRNQSFSDFIDSEIVKLIDYGFVPCVLERDMSKIKRQTRWLDLQLVPVERSIPVRNEDGVVESWDKAYEDIGVRAMYPDIVKQWDVRLKKMGVDKLTFAYQYEDLAPSCIKTGHINSWVMGLGKTIQALLIQAILTNKRVLIVVPSKLIGEWQNEIEGLFAEFMFKNKKNWRGERIKNDYQIIEWASECKVNKLKTINLIAYETCQRVPRDARFHVCPECSFVVCTLNNGTDKAGNPLKGLEAGGHMPCPKCNHGIAKEAKAYNKKHGLKKKHVSKVNPLTGEARRIVVDDRIKPKYIFMEPVEDRYKKIVVRDNIPIEKDVHVGWTFAKILRGRFNLIELDEALFIANPDSQRAQCIRNLTARRRIAFTGTPMKGNPVSVLTIINWATKKTVYPDFRMDEDKRAKGKFLDKYGTYVQVESANGSGKIVSKLLPKINNPEGFQTDLASIFIRRIRNEPLVASVIPPIRQHLDRQIIDMDSTHRAYYKLWLEKFAEWWAEMKKLSAAGEKTGGGAELMIKLGYLRNASTCPHHVAQSKDGDSEGQQWAKVIGPYKGPLTAKQKFTFNLAAKAHFEGDKALVFSDRRANLDLGHKWCEKNHIPSLVVHGGVSNKRDKATNRSPRHKVVQQFRNEDYSVMFAGLQALSVGVNIPEANHGVFIDLPWEPSLYKQAIGRMDRPQQKKPIYVTMLMHKGTVDDYMTALCILKARSADEAIDHDEFKEFGKSMIPDPVQYANAIVDGTEETLKREMWIEIESIFGKKEEEGENIIDSE